MVILEEPSMPSLVTDTTQQDIVVDTAVDLEDSEDTEESLERAITENNLATRAFTPVDLSLMVVLWAATVSKAFSANSTAEATATASATGEAIAEMTTR